MENKRVELLVERSTKHGQAGRETKSRTYLIWQSMIGRCHRPSDSSYRWYGAKGVTVCDRYRTPKRGKGVGMSQHHPSCTENDKELVWLCAQCGGHQQ